jgi:hypothetical protein
VLIAEEFVLLCLDDTSGTSTFGVVYEPALGGALLGELALRERVGVRPGDRPERPVLAVTDGSPTDDPVLDETLEHLLRHEGTTVYDVVNAFKPPPFVTGLRERLLARLAEAGVLRREQGRLLRIFPRTTWPTNDPGPEEEVQRRLERALLGGETPSERTVALIGLLRASAQLQRVVPSEDHKALEARAAALGEGDWAAGAVKQAVDEFLLVTLML